MTTLTSPQINLLLVMAHTTPVHEFPSWHVACWTHKRSPYTLATLRQCVCLGLVEPFGQQGDHYRITPDGVKSLEAGWVQ